MTTRDVEYPADGRTMVGRLALPPGDDRRPGVLIAHEGNGLDEYQKQRAERFADLGYVAFALDYHGGGEPLPDRAAISEHISGLFAAPERTQALGLAGLGVLLAEPRVDPTRIAAVGYCFGGTLVVELGRTGAQLDAIVGFHPGLTVGRPGESARIRAKVLMCVGADDPLISAEQRLAFEADMRESGVDWRVNLYGGAQHSFTNPRAGQSGLDGLAYHRPTDERSWRAMLDLFAEVWPTDPT